jgi:cobaltochelatase CobS
MTTTTALTPKAYPMSVFGIQGTNVTVTGFENTNNPNVPALKDYEFRRDVLRDVIGFIDCSFGDGLLIFGPTGSGKTSIVEQVAARLQMPTTSYTCGGRTRFMDWVGQYVLINGDTVWQDGPLTSAMRNGGIFIANEIDLMSPDELSQANGILEGAPLVIAQRNGEVIRPHESFRFVATANSNGSGSDGMYSGVQRQNMAFLDRFIVIYVDYLDEETEVKLLTQIAPKIPKEVITKMVQVANKVRTIFKGEQEDEGELADVELSVTFSTRTLIRWVVQTQRSKGAPCALSYALTKSLLNRVSDKSEALAIHTIAASIFGKSYKAPDEL